MLQSSELPKALGIKLCTIRIRNDSHTISHQTCTILCTIQIILNKVYDIGISCTGAFLGITCTKFARKKSGRWTEATKGQMWHNSWSPCHSGRKKRSRGARGCFSSQAGGYRASNLLVVSVANNSRGPCSSHVSAQFPNSQKGDAMLKSLYLDG